MFPKIAIIVVVTATLALIVWHAAPPKAPINGQETPPSRANATSSLKSSSVSSAASSSLKVGERSSTKGYSGTGLFKSEKYGFEMTFPQGWSYFAREEPYGDVTKLVQFVPFPEDAPWGDSFGGFVFIHPNVTDFQQWFESNQKFGGERTQQLLDEMNAMHGEDHYTMDDFQTAYIQIVIDGQPAILQSTRCLDEEGCYFFGALYDYVESWYIFKQSQVTEVKVMTYHETHLTNILATFNFLD